MLYQVFIQNRENSNSWDILMIGHHLKLINISLQIESSFGTILIRKLQKKILHW